MDLSDLFADDFRPEISEIEGIALKAVPQGAGQIDVAMPISLWPAAVALGKYLRGRDYQEMRTVELGAGTGFLSLYLLKHNVITNAVVTDCVPSSLALISENLALNGLTASVQSLDWASCPPHLAGKFDLILGSDVMCPLVSYSEAAVQPLYRAIKTLLAPSGTALIANQQHRVWRFSSIISSFLSEFGFSCETTELERGVKLQTLRIA